MPNPGMELDRTPFADKPLVATQPVGPFHRPPASEVGMVQQAVDQTATLVGSRVSQEGTGLDGCRQTTVGIQ